MAQEGQSPLLLCPTPPLLCFSALCSARHSRVQGALPQNSAAGGWGACTRSQSLNLCVGTWVLVSWPAETRSHGNRYRGTLRRWRHTDSGMACWRRVPQRANQCAPDARPPSITTPSDSAGVSSARSLPRWCPGFGTFFERVSGESGGRTGSRQPGGQHGRPCLGFRWGRLWPIDHTDSTISLGVFPQPLPTSSHSHALSRFRTDK
jgi:hypothetical protein